MNFVPAQRLDYGSFQAEFGRVMVERSTAVHVSGSALLGVRPEHVRVRPDSEDAPGTNEYSAHVRAMSYLGARMDLMLRMKDGREWSAPAAAGAHFAVGDTVRVDIPATEWHVFPPVAEAELTDE
jgi:ABC-type Fe3+/spermidine/putrescine transport system ATPase subunit